MRAAVGATLVTALGLLLAAGVRAQEAEESEVDERALEILMRSAERIAGAARIRATIDVSYDVVQEWGQELEFGAIRKVALRRPDRARIEFARRDGRSGTFIYDGERIWLHSPTENVYATTPAPEPNDALAALEYTASALQTPVGLADMFRADLPDLLRELLQSGDYVGEDVIDGVPCHHLAFRGPETDAQFWIAVEGEPLPRRIVITYREEEGSPSFRARIREWDLEAELPGSLFAFEPPEGAERIPIATVESLPEETAEEGEGP